jgi:hypothetical protein
MKGKGSLSGIRIVYALFPDLPKIEFVEIYYKKKTAPTATRREFSGITHSG